MSSESGVLSATSQEIKLNLVDLMACMTEERGNQIGTPVVIPVDTSTKNAIIGVISEFAEFKRTDVYDFTGEDATIPYDLETDIGIYPIDILRQIFELFPLYEMYYDADGVYTVRPIPTSQSSTPDVAKEILDDLLISESKSVDFAEIKNTTEIWGAELSGDYVILECTHTNSQYNGTIDATFTTLESGKTFTIVPDINSVSGQTLKIQDTSAHPIVTVNGEGTVYTPIPAGTMKEGTAYVLRYFNEKFVLQGELFIRCIVQEITEEPSASIKAAYMASNNCMNVKWIVNPDNPYACYISSGIIEGEKRQVFNDGEYANITTTELAYERASYENWLKCRLQDTVDLEMILIPWLDVNDKIEYTSPMTGDVGTWLVKSISYDFNNWTMKVKANRFYSAYPWVE